ncbi:hypothetical protein ACA910_015877 [Epithemia clementina (nom. ined.)]
MSRNHSNRQFPSVFHQQQRAGAARNGDSSRSSLTGRLPISNATNNEEEDERGNQSSSTTITTTTTPNHMFEDSDEGAPPGDEQWISLLGGRGRGEPQPHQHAVAMGDEGLPDPSVHFPAPETLAAAVEGLALLRMDQADLLANRSCCVCSNNYKLNDMVYCLPCGHLLHQPCLDFWLDQHTNCPFCSFNLSNVHEESTSSPLFARDGLAPPSEAERTTRTTTSDHHASSHRSTTRAQNEDVQSVGIPETQSGTQGSAVLWNPSDTHVERTAATAATTLDSSLSGWGNIPSEHEMPPITIGVGTAAATADEYWFQDFDSSPIPSYGGEHQEPDSQTFTMGAQTLTHNARGERDSAVTERGNVAPVARARRVEEHAFFAANFTGPSNIQESTGNYGSGETAVNENPWWNSFSNDNDDDEQALLDAAMRTALEASMRGENNAGSPRACARAVKDLPLIRIRMEDLEDLVNSRCCLCLEDYRVSDTLVRLPCAHFFHQKCLYHWLSESCSCPSCRYELPTDDPEYERGRLERMQVRKQRFVLHELERLPTTELKQLLPPNNNNYDAMEQRELLNLLINNGIVDLVPSPEPVEYSMEALRRMTVVELRRCMSEEAGVLVEDTDLVDKEEMIRKFRASGRLKILASDRLEGDGGEIKSSHENVSARPSPSSNASPPSRLSSPRSSSSSGLQVKNELYKWFNQEHRLSIGRDTYFTWDNGGECHKKLFSSVFVDPSSGECFPSGRYGGESDFVLESLDPGLTPTVWYFTKKAAESGAAARAYDCLLYREAIKKGQEYQPICLDMPSLHRLPIPQSMPEEVYRSISEAW